MNRLLVVLVTVVLGSAFPGGAVADSGRGGATGLVQLILVFFSDVSRNLLPKRVVVDDKDKKTAKGAEQERDTGKSQEGRRLEAYARLEQQEHEARKAREEYRREALSMVSERHDANDPHADGQERDVRRAREEQLRVAERRMTEREWELQRAKEEYQREARKAREERLRDAEGSFVAVGADGP